MRAVSRVRTPHFRSYVLPFLLAALAFRVLVPPEAMMSGGNTILRAAMCATTGKNETIELPAAAGKMHCDECMAPPLGVPLAQVHIHSPLLATPSIPTPVAAQISDTPLVRAQSARAPPLA